MLQRGISESNIEGNKILKRINYDKNLYILKNLFCNISYFFKIRLLISINLSNQRSLAIFNEIIASLALK